MILYIRYKAFSEGSLKVSKCVYKVHYAFTFYYSQITRRLRKKKQVTSEAFLCTQKLKEK